MAIGTPIDRAVYDVRSAIQQIRGDLPDGILEPQVGRVDSASDNDIACFTAIAPDMTVEQLSWFIDNTVAKQPARIEGMSVVSRRAASTARSASSSIRPGCNPTASPPARSTSSCAQVNLNAAGGRAEKFPL